MSFKHELFSASVWYGIRVDPLNSCEISGFVNFVTMNPPYSFLFNSGNGILSTATYEVYIDNATHECT